MAFCSNCGSENLDNARFCSDCGGSLDSTPKPSSYQTKPIEYQPQTSGYQPPQSNYPPQYGQPQPYMRPPDQVDSYLYLCAFCIPIVGLILFLVYKDERPQSAKNLLIAGAAGFGLGFLFNLATFAIG